MTRRLNTFALWAAVVALLASPSSEEEIEIVAVGISIIPRINHIYDTVTTKLRIQGENFEGDGTNLHLGFNPPMPQGSYALEVDSSTQLNVYLKAGHKWPTTTGKTETLLYANSLKNDLNDDPDAELMSSPVPVASILATPSITRRDDKLLYMSGHRQLYINGTNFRRKETMFIFDPPLFQDFDYVMEVKSPNVAQLTLVEGRRWRSDGVPGPLKIKRLTTGAGELKIDSKYGGVTVAEIQADLGPHGVTVETTSDKKLYQSSPSLTILGAGFNASGTGGNTLRWANSLRGRGINYTVTEAQANQLTLTLTSGSKWRANPGNLPGPLTLLAVNAGAGPIPVGATAAKKGRVVATIYADPSIDAYSGLTLSRTLDHELWVTGRGFTRGGTSLDLRAKSAKGQLTSLRQFVDYVPVAFNSTHFRIWLSDGKAWAPEADSELECVGVNTGAGEFFALDPSIVHEPVLLAKIVADPEPTTAASITRTVTTQMLYETPTVKKLTITGENLCSSSDNKVVMPQDVQVEFSPHIDQATVFTVTKVTPTHITLDLKKKQRWPVGTLSVVSLQCDTSGATPAQFAAEDGVAVATILQNPVIEPHPELILYSHSSKRLILRGSGLSVACAELTLAPTSPKSYRIVACYEDDVIELALTDADSASWVPDGQLPQNGSGVALRVVEIDTGAGALFYGEADDPDSGVVVATVVTEPEGDVCNDLCQWARDGICDDGTQPYLLDEEAQRSAEMMGRHHSYFDDDYGGLIYDDDDDIYLGPYGFENPLEAGYDDYGYGFLHNLKDDQAYSHGSHAHGCAPGTDCTDCQPRGGDAWLKEVPDASCDNSCEFARDDVCDDGRDGYRYYCDPGTDCQDCGPIGASNMTRSDSFWVDDDDANIYFSGGPNGLWDDDASYDDFYFYSEARNDNANASGRASSNSSSGAGGKKKAVSRDDDDDLPNIHSQPNPFQIDPEVTSGGDSFASLLIAGTFVAILSLAACTVLRFTSTKGKKSGCLPFLSAKAKEETNRDLTTSWSDMTARRDKKKADVPITPDVTYSGNTA